MKCHVNFVVPRNTTIGKVGNDWRLYAILTFLFNDYYKKNKKINGRYVEMEGNYSHEWKMDINWYFKPTQRDLDDPKE